MKIPVLTFVLLSSLSAASFAATNGCIIEGEISTPQGTSPIKDCLQNVGVPGGQFLEICKGLMQAGLKAGIAAKLTLADRCPSGYQGRCISVLEAPMDSYYYGRSSGDLQQFAVQCQTQGGRWSSQ